MTHEFLTKLMGGGLYLVPIAPDNGKPTKAPRAKGWNQPRSASNPAGYSSNPADFADCTGFNFGLFHGASGTLALDLDDVEQAARLFDELAGITLTAWLDDPDRVEVKSPKANRGKLLFKLPADIPDAGLKQLKHNNAVVFELRCGNCQDVIYGKHPEGGAYQLIGDPSAIPPAPQILIDMLENWDDWRSCFDSALGIETDLPKIPPQRPQPGVNLAGSRDPISEFNQSFAVAEILIRNGYKQCGADRFVRPGSSSKAPGVAILRNCTDGVDRVFSHGGDVLNDGFAHDAFDTFRLLECGGDWRAALNWNPEITKQNRRVFMNQQDGADEAADGGWSCDWAKPGAGEKTSGAGFPFIRADELTAKPITNDWLLEGIVERGSLNLLFGAPSAGKSLFALDWAFCVAAGLEWHGHRTNPCDVVIIAGEGYAGMARRLKALEQKYNAKAPQRLFISRQPAQLLDKKSAALVAESIGTLCENPGLIIVDTLHRNMQGDENSSEDIGQFISNLDNFFKPLGAAILVVHHSGHGEKDRSRGSSSIRAAMDAEFSVTKDADSIVLSCWKAKDFEVPKPLRFELKTVELLDWLDDDGEPLDSVYLEHMGEAKPVAKCKKLSARDDAILTSLAEAIDAHGVEPSPAIKEKFAGFDKLNPDRKVVHIDYWRETAYHRLEGDTSEFKRKAFQRCRNKLFELGRVCDFDNLWWPVYPSF